MGAGMGTKTHPWVYEGRVPRNGAGRMYETSRVFPETATTGKTHESIRRRSYKSGHLPASSKSFLPHPCGICPSQRIPPETQCSIGALGKRRPALLSWTSIEVNPRHLKLLRVTRQKLIAKFIIMLDDCVYSIYDFEFIQLSLQYLIKPGEQVQPWCLSQCLIPLLVINAQHILCYLYIYFIGPSLFYKVL